jgi:hypothetical protein
MARPSFHTGQESSTEGGYISSIGTMLEGKTAGLVFGTPTVALGGELLVE